MSKAHTTPSLPEEGYARSLPPGPVALPDSLPVEASGHWGTHEHTIMVLQGGGAMGAYQAGVYAGLDEAGVDVDWVTGVSIGAINAALIAGTSPGRRVERLREFWDRMSALFASPVPFTFLAGLDLLRPMMNRAHATTAALFGVPGFFVPRHLPPAFAPEGNLAALSYYDTEPLRKTLLDLIDFDLINQKKVRLSLGAVNVGTGGSMYFDNTKMRIGPEHVMASGALPPAFPPVDIDGDLFWDGGIVSNSPLTYVMDEVYRSDALIFQIDLFSGFGEPPKNLDQVQERIKDIQYATKQRFNISRLQEFEDLRGALGRVIDKLPESLQSSSDVQKLKAISTRGALTLVQFTNQHDTSSSFFKDCEFSRATVDELWNAGQLDVRQAMTRPELRQPTEIGHKMRVYDATR